MLVFLVSVAEDVIVVDDSKAACHDALQAIDFSQFYFSTHYYKKVEMGVCFVDLWGFGVYGDGRFYGIIGNFLECI